MDRCGSISDYYPVKLRLFFTGKLKQLANRISQDNWDSKLRPGAAKLVHKLKRAREMKLTDSVRKVAILTTRLIGGRGCGIVFIMCPEDLREAKPMLKPDEQCAFHENEFYDLLFWRGASLEISTLISEKARSIPQLLKSGRTLHTLLINESLVAWGISCFPQEPAVLNESGGAIFKFEPESVSLYDFYTLPEIRGRKSYKALLVHILRLRFGQGAKLAYIGVAANNVASAKRLNASDFA